MRPIATLLAVACLWSSSASADTEFAGYIKSFAVFQGEPDITGIDTNSLAQSQNSARLMWDTFGDDVVFQVHYEIGAIFSSRSPDFPTGTIASPNAWRVADLDNTIKDDPRKTWVQNLDRLNVQWIFESGDLTIGRQPITFGMARVINPTDVFLPFDVRTLNTEYRIGVDAVRFQRPFGQLGELDFGVILGEDADPDTSAAYFQMRTNAAGSDYQLAVVKFADDTLVGGGIQTALGNVGFWLEVASVTGNDDFVRVSTGVDYAFTEDMFAMVEYHYNGAGTGDPDEYLSNAATLPYQSGAVFLLGKHYLIPVVTYSLTPLIGVSAQAIMNLDDSSAFVSLSAEYNVATDFYMDFGYYHFIGDGITTPPPVLGSEYGGSPDTLYVSMRYYF